MQIGSAGILKIVCLIFYLFVLRQSASSLRQFILVFKKKKKREGGERTKKPNQNLKAEIHYWGTELIIFDLGQTYPSDDLRLNSQYGTSLRLDSGMKVHNTGTQYLCKGGYFPPLPATFNSKFSLKEMSM